MNALPWQDKSSEGAQACPVHHKRKKRRLQITLSPACKRGTKTIRKCHREGRSKHKDSWRVSGTGEEQEGVRLRID